MEAVVKAPSMALYLRETADWQEIVELSEGSYGFGYEMGMRDAKAGFPMLEDIPIGYGEGYRDGYGDWA